MFLGEQSQSQSVVNLAPHRSSVLSPRSADKRWLVPADLRCGVGAASKHGAGELGEVWGDCKILHPVGVKIAGFIPLCAKIPSLRPPPRPYYSNSIPSRSKKP